MKAVVLAGGFGTRLSEETDRIPKPMVEIGGLPILWHILKIYSRYGINDFIICLGYKGYMIKEYFSNYFLHMSDVTLDLRNQKLDVHRHTVEPWRITLIDTGLRTLTGGRLKRIAKFVKGESFCMTYGDGLGDVKIDKTIEFHRRHGKLVTVTAISPPGRFGAMHIEDQQVTSFAEKVSSPEAFINGGFFVMKPEALEYIEGDQTNWEKDCLPKISSDGQLMAYRHEGFWQPMDTLREKNLLEELWQSGKAAWKVWT